MLSDALPSILKLKRNCVNIHQVLSHDPSPNSIFSTISHDSCGITPLLHQETFSHFQHFPTEPVPETTKVFSNECNQDTVTWIYWK
mmetsp:Transcript_17512/g.40826  ORF Transcript_17512/g.40826 Transcript_17512/m.40826 type:complete len:86 (-) Transcript_17512:29-286(-)